MIAEAELFLYDVGAHMFTESSAEGSGGPRNLGRPLRWEAVRFPKGVNHEEEASESLAGVQG